MEIVAREHHGIDRYRHQRRVAPHTEFEDAPARDDSAIASRRSTSEWRADHNVPTCALRSMESWPGSQGPEVHATRYSVR